MADTQTEKILKKLRETKTPLNQIAKITGLSNSTLKNYIEGKTNPNKANISILEMYFSENSGNFSQNSGNTGNVVVGNDNNGNIDNRQYYSDSPDVLRAQIDVLDERIREKDAQIREKDAQIREKDAQIKELLNIISQMSKKG